jgi:stage V sporulation protein B
MPNLSLAVGGATLAVTLSEAFALLWIYYRYKKEIKRDPFYFKPNKINFFKNAKIVIKTTVPITLVGLILPISQFIDSFIVVNLLRQYSLNATALYGLLFGVGVTIINLPVAICYGLAQVAIPSVSSVNIEEERAKRSIKVMYLTLFASILGAILTFTLCTPAVNILFRSLSTGERYTAIKIIKLLSPSVVFLALTQTTNAVLIARGKAYYPLIGLIIGAIVKIILELTLVSNPSLNIFGGGIALIACYFTICLLNLIILISVGVKNANKTAYNGQPVS